MKITVRSFAGGGRPALLRVFTTALIIGAAPARAEGDFNAAHVYLGIIQDEPRRPAVAFIFSDPDKPGVFSPMRGFSINPSETGCNMRLANGADIRAEDKKRPVFIPGDAAYPVAISDLPVYLAATVTITLARLAMEPPLREEETLPYHACTRITWEGITGQ